MEVRVVGAFTVVALVLAQGCSSGTRCPGDCPRVDGTYSILAGPNQGSCDFEPYLFSTSLPVEQSTDGASVSATILDPINALPVPLAGNLVLPANTDQTIASMRLHNQTTRAATVGGPTIMLDIELTATVKDINGVRHLDGQLVTMSLPTTADAGASCSVYVPFSADR